MRHDRASTVADAQRALAQGGSYRAVHRAALRLPAGASPEATRHALEDALRTAEFNDAGRLILVRALRLRGLPAGASGPQMARALEQAWQGLAPQALPFDAPGAAVAPAVYFRSVHAARAAWLQRFALDAPLAEWFWPLALPECAAAATAAETLPQLLAALQAHAAPGLVAQMLAWPVHALRRVLAALPATAQTEPLLALAGVVWAPHVLPPLPGQAMPPQTTSAAPAARGVKAGMRLPPPPAVRQTLGALQLHFAPHDARLRWLVALIHRVDTGEWPGPAQVAQILVEAGDHAADAATAPPPWARSWPDAGRHIAAPREAIAAAATQSVRPVAAPPPARPAAGPLHGTAAHQTRPRPWAPWLDDGQATPLGGLLMVLNALEVLRFPAWLAHQAPALAQAFTAALLARIAGRLRIGETDPQAPVLALSAGQRRLLAVARLPPFAHQWPAGFSSSGLQPAAPTVAAALALWQRALGRLLRHHAGLGLAHLVVRDAGVSITPTHIDVVLPLDQADMAVRRAALDRDPGWLPWFGWIVSFHYVGAARAGDV